MIWIVIAIGALLLFGLLLGILLFSTINTYIFALVQGMKDISLLQLVGMRLRGINPRYIVQEMVELRKAGIHGDFDIFESHVLAGGDLSDVVRGMVSAVKADLNVSFDQLCAIDLAGREVSRAINACVNPLVIQVPRQGERDITGVCADGIRLGVQVKVTVKAEISKLVGGANEETIIARVGEGIVVACGRAASHKDILEQPNTISEFILNNGLDARTSFHIVSVDVNNVEVLDNIGAKLREEQAEADRQIAQAKAEERRAIAYAASQENRAKILGMKALETKNKAEIPADMAHAYRKGKIWYSPNPVYSVIKPQMWDASSDS